MDKKLTKKQETETEDQDKKPVQDTDKERADHDSMDEQANAPNSNKDQGNKKERLFTQEELNKIIADRLSRVKTGEDLEERENALIERENALNIRENTMLARDLLKENNIDTEYLPLVDVSSPEQVQESINLIINVVNKVEKPETTGMRHASGLRADSDVRRAFFEK